MEESNSKYLTSINLNLKGNDLNQKITLRIVYNPPISVEGINTLKEDMQDKDTRTSPIIVAMDENLHQKLRNPNGYSHTHPKEKELIKWCRSKVFKLTSPKITPTYMGSNGTATTVDLTWENLPEI
ncbi:hypothetical protein O181_116709 [Austropuccinia psidii MF-1]|uniref:Endonuclease/exonuclease/phosphatase domain-containing protein n=1 Tax=Austropuccinia psidii MF-1 TaxID=1389203 RepID=A0A9Q3PWT3_9BASI|nr:hypothetical protein [Austropuccinia psidii MF-1]